MKTKRINASIGLRYLALIIDSSVWLLIGFILLFNISSQTSTELVILATIHAVIFIFLFSLINAILTSFLISRFGGSIGKLICGIEIVTDEGSYLSFSRSFLRTYAGYGISSAFLGLGFLWAVKNPDNKTWHDMMIGSFVVRRTRYGVITALLTLLSITSIVLALGIGSARLFEANFSVYQEFGALFFGSSEMHQMIETPNNIDYEAEMPERRPVSERNISIPM